MGISGQGARLRAWEQGASGERIVGARLDRIVGIEVLHDRRIPGSRTAIDHIVIGPGGAYVVDARLHGAMVRHRGLIGVHRDEHRVLNDRHDQGKLVVKMRAQVGAIARALAETPIPVIGALCFVEARPPLPTRPFMLDGVWIGWPEALPELVGRPGLLDPETMRQVALLLDDRLRPS